MNVYSEQIIYDIVNAYDCETAENKTNEFYKDAETMFCFFSHQTICLNYTLNLLRNENNKMAFYSMDTDNFHISNCPTGMIYTDEIVNNVKTHYILMICTRPRFKNMGYASIMLTEFIEYIQHQNEPGQTQKIILSSLESAVTFYEKYGFRWTRNSITNYPILMECEDIQNDNEEHFIMELVVS